VQARERTLHMLATVGIRVDSNEGRAILRDAGALVERADAERGG